jgi:hypothetical protein
MRCGEPIREAPGSGGYVFSAGHPLARRAFSKGGYKTQPTLGTLKIMVCPERATGYQTEFRIYRCPK